jgi:hypothetical protein
VLYGELLDGRQPGEGSADPFCAQFVIVIAPQFT